MTTYEQFKKQVYLFIKGRTIEVKNGSKMPFISWKSAKMFGKKQGFDARPTFVAIEDLLKGGAIYQRWDNKIGQYRYIAKI
jgi:hypothetical protein